jgi:hypothetical protein
VSISAQCRLPRLHHHTGSSQPIVSQSSYGYGYDPLLAVEEAIAVAETVDFVEDVVEEIFDDGW